jgi:hypothetical protein
MGRIRSIKPEFPQSETIGNLSRDARLLFIQLWTIVDDDGKARAASRMLASLLYPYDDDAPKLIEKWLGELEREQCLIRYDVDGSRYLKLTNWLKHQKIDHPSRSKFPDPRESSRILAPDMDQDRDREEDQDKERDQEETRTSALSLAKQSFSKFWDAWPNRVGKPLAQRAFAKALAKHGLNTILAGLDRYIRSKPPDRAWLNPATFLNQERFLDDPAPSPEARAGPSGTSTGNLSTLMQKMRNQQNGEQSPSELKDITPTVSEPGASDHGSRLSEPTGKPSGGGEILHLRPASPDARRSPAPHSEAARTFEWPNPEWERG